MPDTRVIRVIEGDGEDQKTQDFEVPTAFLKFSEVFAPMCEDDKVMLSDDNVIPVHEPIESIEWLIGWLTRAPSFQIKTDNMMELARLSDKYIVEALHKDIQNFVALLVWKKEPPTFHLWRFAARYSFADLEYYCRADPQVFKKLVKTIRDPTKGVSRLQNQDQIPMAALNTLVSNIISRLQAQRDEKQGKLNTLRHVGITCNLCNVKNIRGLRFRCKECINYDLCENCFAKRKRFEHDEVHLFKQIPQRLAPLLD